MDGKDLIELLRKSDESPDISKALSELGVTKKLKMPKDDIEARIDLPKKGLSLIFKPEAPKTSKLVFTAVQFFSDASEGFTTFPGKLVESLQFNDTQAEVRKKLGKPAEIMKDLRRDQWNLKGLVLTVKYSRKDGRIGMISVHVPEYY